MESLTISAGWRSSLQDKLGDWMKEQTLGKRIETRRRILSNKSSHTRDKKGLRNWAERGEYVSKEGPFPGRDPSFAFPVCPVRSAAVAGMFLPRARWRIHNILFPAFFSRPASKQSTQSTVLVLCSGKASKLEIITCHYHQSFLQAAKSCTFIYRFRFFSLDVVGHCQYISM